MASVRVECNVCGGRGKLVYQCIKCGLEARYCGNYSCQAEDWDTHQRECNKNSTSLEIQENTLIKHVSGGLSWSRSRKISLSTPDLTQQDDEPNIVLSSSSLSLNNITSDESDSEGNLLSASSQNWKGSGKLHPKRKTSHLEGVSEGDEPESVIAEVPKQQEGGQERAERGEGRDKPEPKEERGEGENPGEDKERGQEREGKPARKNSLVNALNNLRGKILKDPGTGAAESPAPLRPLHTSHSSPSFFEGKEAPEQPEGPPPKKLGAFQSRLPQRREAEKGKGGGKRGEEEQGEQLGGGGEGDHAWGMGGERGLRTARSNSLVDVSRFKPLRPLSLAPLQRKEGILYAFFPFVHPLTISRASSRHNSGSSLAAMKEKEKEKKKADPGAPASFLPSHLTVDPSFSSSSSSSPAPSPLPPIDYHEAKQLAGKYWMVLDDFFLSAYSDRLETSAPLHEINLHGCRVVRDKTGFPLFRVEKQGHVLLYVFPDEEGLAEHKGWFQVLTELCEFYSQQNNPRRNLSHQPSKSSLLPRATLETGIFDQDLQDLTEAYEDQLRKEEPGAQEKNDLFQGQKRISTSVSLPVELSGVLGRSGEAKGKAEPRENREEEREKEAGGSGSAERASDKEAEKREEEVAVLRRRSQLGAGLGGNPESQDGGLADLKKAFLEARKNRQTVLIRQDSQSRFNIPVNRVRAETLLERTLSARESEVFRQGTALGHDQHDHLPLFQDKQLVLSYSINPSGAVDRYMVTAGTIDMLVERLADEDHPDSSYINIFLLGYRYLMSSASLMDHLTTRFNAIPSNNPFSSNNPFVQPQQPFAPTQSWPIANGSGTCTPFDPIPEFDNSSALFHRPMQSQTPFSNPGGVTMFSPVNASNPSLPTSPHNIPKRMRPGSPAIRSHNELRRGDGIRKKNARFDIPAERTLSNIDQLISQSTDEQEIKELKQQKRLLRNRQAALDSRQRKKQHTERLEDEKKQFTALVGDMEEEIASLRKQLENAHLVNRQLEEEHIKMRIDNENLIASHTLETGELRKKVSVLTSHVQRLESSAMTSTNTSDSNFSSAFNDMNDMTMEGAWNSMGFLDDFAMDTDVKQEQQLVPVKKQEPSDLEKPAAQGGLLFMLFLVGAFVLSNRSSAVPTIPRVSEDVRAASATLLDNIFKEAGVGQSGVVEAMAPRPSGTASSWTAVPSVPAVGAMDGVAPSMLGELADSLTQPTEEQANEQLFGLSAEQYNSINGQDFMQTTPERAPSQARRNLADALVAMRSNSKQSTAEVYTRSLLWDQIPSEVVRDFAKMVAECKSTACD